MSGATAPRPLMAGVGLLAGGLSGLLGIGGGLVVGPVLLLRGLPLTRATGTALAMVPGVALVGVLVDLQLQPEPLPWMLALAVACGGPFGLKAGRMLLKHLPERALWTAFLLLLAATLARLLLASTRATSAGWLATADGPAAWAVAGLGGVLAGIAAILFGVGGGVVVVPLLAFSLPGIDVALASALSLAAMVPTASLGLLGAMRDGRVERPWLLPLLLGGAPGAVLGVWLRGRVLSTRELELAFAAFLLFVLWRLWGRRPRGG
jgi:uncharacterized membrane protein YfcA